MSEAVTECNKVAALFDGQGFYGYGMGKEAHDRYAAAREVFKDARVATGVDMARVCFGDLDFLLEDTRVAQAAIVTVDLAEWAAYIEKYGKPNVVTGMSLGYLAAMGAAEVFSSYGDTISASFDRAKILYAHHKDKPGGMAGFVGLAMHELDPILKKTGAKLAVTRDKLRHSFVVTGSHDQIKDTEVEVKSRGVRRFEKLQIFGWFHHNENEDAQPEFAEALSSYSLKDPTIRLLGNNALFLNSAAEAAQHAVDQLVDPVEWDDVIEVLHREGVASTVELGADDSRGLNRQMSKRFKTESIAFPEAA